MFRRFAVTALLVGGLFGCLPQSQIPARPPQGPDPIEPVGLDAPNITGEWIVENGDKSLRQLWALEMTGNKVTGTFETLPDDQAPGIVEPPRPVDGFVIGSGTTWGVRLNTPTNGLISIQSREQFTFCPKPGGQDCRVARRKTATPAPSASGVPSARPSWVFIN